MENQRRPHRRSEFEIAVICALQAESDAVEAVFDTKWEYTFGKAPADPNTYSTGRIGGYNVVLVFLPSMGKACAASATASFLSSFPAIKLVLVVGICGAVPTDPTDATKEILLGDAIISTGIVQYDFGRQFSDKVVRKDSLEDNLSRPTKEVRSFLRKVSGLEGCRQLQNDTIAHLTEICEKKGNGAFNYPSRDEDKLYKPTYRHKHHNSATCTVCARCVRKEDETCTNALESSCDQLGCSEMNLVVRSRSMKGEKKLSPQIHFGLVASGDLVMKSGYHRDEIARREKVIAFEMEGAGVWDNFSTIIIKGVCDYADSHKNKKWQRYAAAVAAACMKAFLSQWIAVDKATQPEATASSTFAQSRGMQSCNDSSSTDRGVLPVTSDVSIRHADLWRLKTPLTTGDTDDEDASLVEGYDYVYFIMIVVIWNLQQKLKKRRFVVSLLLVLQYLCLSPLSPLSWRCVQFEDALGRIQRLPFELCRNLDAFNKFLIDDFHGRPGWHKVIRSQYVIASGRFGGAIITPQQWLSTIQPGGLLTMIIRVDSKGKSCPRCQKELSQAETRCRACLQFYRLLIKWKTMGLDESRLNTAQFAKRPAGPRTLEDTFIDEHGDVDMSYFKYTFSSPSVTSSREPSEISHPRSFTKSTNPVKDEETVTSSSEDSDSDDEPLKKPPMVRKKGGQLVRPALRPSARHRPSSMPGTPTYEKAVHFDTQLEHIRHFLQLDRPLATSADTSPVDECEEEGEFTIGVADVLSSSSEDSDSDDEPLKKPPMVRKKGGQLVRPALRPPSARRQPSDMPGTPTYAKAVHFDAKLEHIRHFLQLDRSLATSLVDK
ncbi:5'-methylthioadenosine/S-adenosylhomocysteine nucleosidase family protein [Aspergillus melleus]|uniref:5'-methylthioadenosine/S-adenosylhomocysteine nucleosidase family protein n=1 Tax=Aspergillus melleus TaxID=138277 RepID=UPI001E8E24D2|nr:uncharacterized protein LDX57_001929 [Aspergillus melleus]KAH8424174.1 hypothetical protein LDX57_001929 [Aspergillus melleus]